MQLERVDKRKRMTSATTIASMGEENDAEKPLPSCAKKIPRGNVIMMKKKTPKHLPPRKEEVQKIGSREIEQPLRKLLEGTDQVCGLMIARQNSETNTAAMRNVASIGGGECVVPPQF